MKDGKYLTAKQKEQIAKAWERFIASGLKKEKFTKALYQHLHLSFFIAHYNIHGFYDARFDDPTVRTETFNRIINAEPWYFSDENASECGDLNRAIRDVAVRYYDQVKSQAAVDEIRRLEFTVQAAQSRIAILKKHTGTTNP